MIDDTKKLKEYEFNIINYNGNCVIDSCAKKGGEFWHNRIAIK